MTLTTDRLDEIMEALADDMSLFAFLTPEEGDAAYRDALDKLREPELDECETSFYFEVVEAYEAAHAGSGCEIRQ